MKCKVIKTCNHSKRYGYQKTLLVSLKSHPGSDPGQAPVCTADTLEDKEEKMWSTESECPKRKPDGES